MAMPWEYLYNANADPNDPTSSAALQLRQRIALGMMEKKRAYPKTFGEGLAAIGDSLGEMGTMRQLMAQQAAVDKAQQAEKAAVNKGAGPQAAAEPQTNVAYEPLVDEVKTAQASVFPDPSTAQASIPQSMVAQLGPAPDSYSYRPTAMAASDTASDATPVTGITPAPAAPPPRRDAIANLLTNGSAALNGPEVSQLNPTQAGAPIPPSNLPFSSASLGGPPEAQGNRPIATDIRPPQVVTPGAQVAQAMTLPQPMTQQPTPPRQAPGMYDRPVAPPQPPPVPKDPKQSEYEQKALSHPFVEMREFYKGQAALLEAERAKRQTIANEAYQNQLGTHTQQLRAWEDAQRNMGRTQAETTEAQAKALTAQGGAELTRRTGLPPEAALKKFDALKTTAEKDSYALQQLRLASDAINKGLVTGAGGELRLNIERLKAYMGNASADEIASRTQPY